MSMVLRNQNAMFLICFSIEMMYAMKIYIFCMKCFIIRLFVVFSKPF